MNDYIFNFDMLSQRISKPSAEITSDDLEGVVMYLYLTWLGLSHSEIKSVYGEDYNQNMRVLSVNDRTVYVSDDEIAALISSQEPDRRLIHGSLDFCTTARELAQQIGLAPSFVYKMSFFNMLYKYRGENEPIDKLRYHEMLRISGCEGTEIECEFADYAKQRDEYEKQK